MPQYSYGPASLAIREQLCLELQYTVDLVIGLFDCSLTNGHRNEEEQNKVFAEGKSQKEWPDSMHNFVPSQAVHVLPFPDGYKNLDEMRYLAGMVVMAGFSLGYLIRWGDNWDMDSDLDDTEFHDLAHFEYVGRINET